MAAANRLALAAMALAWLAFPAAAIASDTACDRYETLVTTTPTPEQSPSLLHRAYDVLENMPASPDVLLAGDSITQNWSPKALADTFPGQNVFNFGVNGDETQNLLWRLTKVEPASGAPKVVVLMIGTNNLAAKSANCAVIAGVKAVIARIDLIWRKPLLILVDITPRGKEFSFREEDRQAVNAAINSFVSGRGNSAILSMDQVITCGRALDCQNYKPDHVHLTEAGYFVYGRELRSVYARLLSTSKR